jgi:GNAT superfamily N-acetyltransferase
MRIEAEASLSEEAAEVVRAGMRRQTEKHVPWEGYADVVIVARGEGGEILGAGIGETGRGWLHVSVVLVDEKCRGSGVGRRLVEAMEAEAVRRGCRGAYLDTFSYQARPFYEKVGYEVFGILEDYPVGHQRFYMRKRLGGG